jgi:hypothetical protein
LAEEAGPEVVADNTGGRGVREVDVHAEDFEEESDVDEESELEL